MDTVRIGIVGIGNMGSGHAKYLNAGEIKDCVLAAVCDTDPKRLEWARENLAPSVLRFDDAQTMFESGAVDAVIVAVPHYLHPPMVMAAFRAGLHAISEKPAGVYTKQVEEMNRLADECGLKFSMMFNQRTNPCYQKLRQLVQDGELGELRRVNWIITNWLRPQSYYNSGGWRATWSGEGGGVLMNQSPHQLDLLQWTCGMPSRVFAFCKFGKYHDIETEDDVTAYFEYPNGATGVFITTTGEAPGTNRLEVTGDCGKVVIEDTTLTFFRNAEPVSKFLAECQNSFGKLENEKLVFEFPDNGPQHKGITQNFVNAILRGEALLGQGQEGINGVTLANAMQLSTWTGGWVELPIDGDAYWAQLKQRAEASTFKKTVNPVVADTTGSY